MRRLLLRLLHGPEWTVQLHVDTRDGVAYSHEPLVLRGDVRAARSAAHRLRQDNRWASPGRWPLVTIVDEHGQRVPEVAG
jgi:hypothetical protein